MRAAAGSVLAVYLTGLAQGLTLVSYPSSSVQLRAMHGLSDAEYGLIFLPQVVAAVVGATGGAALARRLGLRRLLVLAVLANALSQMALALVSVVPAGSVLPTLLAGTACLGLGFGLLGAPINAYPPHWFPRQANTALVVMHSLIGVGLMLGPQAEASFAAAGRWIGFPLALLALTLVLAAAAARLPLGDGGLVGGTDRRRASGPSPARDPAFWTFVLIAVLYAFAEGTFSNWAVVYLQDGKGLPPAIAAAALSVFWGALVGGRLLISLLLLWLPTRPLWKLLPVLMIAAFLLLPLADAAAPAIVLFAFAGLACSAFFPLSIALVTEHFPQHVAWVSAMLIAALMVGVGLGSFAIGALRSVLSFESLYRWSALYPALALVLAVSLKARDPRLTLPRLESR